MDVQPEAFAKVAAGQVATRRPQPVADGLEPDRGMRSVTRSGFSLAAQGPGEHGCLTRQNLQYAPGCWPGCFSTPAGCLTASAGFGAAPQGFSVADVKTPRLGKVEASVSVLGATSSGESLCGAHRS